MNGFRIAGIDFRLVDHTFPVTDSHGNTYMRTVRKITNYHVLKYLAPSGREYFNDNDNFPQGRAA